MWLTIADYGPLREQTCEIKDCDQAAQYIWDDRFQRKACQCCRDFRDRWQCWPDDHDWNG